MLFANTRRQVFSRRGPGIIDVQKDCRYFVTLFCSSGKFYCDLDSAGDIRFTGWGSNANVDYHLVTICWNRLAETIPMNGHKMEFALD